MFTGPITNGFAIAHQALKELREIRQLLRDLVELERERRADG
jgi:hypothetical protein